MEVGGGEIKVGETGVGVSEKEVGVGVEVGGRSRVCVRTVVSHEDSLRVRSSLISPVNVSMILWRINQRLIIDMIYI